jgi:hypothetical protein
MGRVAARDKARSGVEFAALDRLATPTLERGVHFLLDLGQSLANPLSSRHNNAFLDRRESHSEDGTLDTPSGTGLHKVQRAEPFDLHGPTVAR